MRPQRFIRLAAYSVIAVAVALMFFNEISKVYFLKNENKRIEKRIEDLETQNRAYREEIKALKQDERYIEKILREELGMIKDKEKIFRFKEE
ncbi:MAG: septum formation initiator family protein [Candidatus Dadabacteria bacterium]|nr:septum formation initiator family protein [Candidatus Dadabacteria bacterium]MDE0477678.1 septum formation initiator family protein [Candidatus Dadabacteria bacterium]MXZ47988.1 septum formation initiator family protein [Candidatus Dadabacteria bacterium]MYB26487.1 septum formation initiator family protein [Candidatus Dadabacteria bacterium]MYI73676.1 septum formation initiator family protein [Candidatus Dadabacteria bacterium]